ncbi:MAG TPA: hypothetical protein ENH91_04570 [Leeuwenhoekiella sp.]|nr:hypothetical protein [Leeuwenhoekiella sp.]
MKTNILNTAFFLFSLLTFTPTIFAQNNCSKFYPTKIGKTLIIHQFDKRDKLATITSYTVKDVAQDENGTILTIAMRLIDGKDEEELTNVEFKAICTGNTTKIDPESLLAPGIFDQYKNMDYSITGNGLSIPNELHVGENLADGDVTMAIDTGIMKINATILMTNRKVQAKEKITVPAGMFDCYKITSTNSFKMGMTQTNLTTQWIAEGIGMVQEETRKPNGRLVSRSILHHME